MLILDQGREQIASPDEVIPDDIPLMELVDGVIRGKYKLPPPQLRVLIAWMPHFAPKLMAINAHYEGSFAVELDKAIVERCIERSKGPPMLNGPVEQIDASEMKKPFPRNYRIPYHSTNNDAQMSPRAPAPTSVPIPQPLRGWGHYFPN